MVVVVVVVVVVAAAPQASTYPVPAHPHLTTATPRWPRYAAIAHGHGVRAARALPLHGPDRSAASGPIGVLALFGSTAGPMAAADLMAAQTFADLAAVALGAGGAAHEPAQPDESARGATAQDQVLIERAIGVIGERHRVGIAEARDLLHANARSRDVHLGEAARAILVRATDPGPNALR